MVLGGQDEVSAAWNSDLTNFEVVTYGPGRIWYVHCPTATVMGYVLFSGLLHVELAVPNLRFHDGMARNNIMAATGVVMDGMEA